MSRLRSMTAQSPAIVISVIALIFALGSGAGYAASRHATASKDLAMHALTLRNGWKSSQGNYGTGNPSYAVQNKIVYLAGSAHQTVSGGNEEIAVLPPSARPKHNLYLSVYTYGGSTGTLFIGRNGVIDGYNESTAVLAEEYISLAGVSFPVGS